MIPNITRGSDPAGLLRYLFGRGRSNEHNDQHMVCASPAITDCFDLDGRPTTSFSRIAHELDRWYRRLAQDGQPMPPDMRGRRNPGHKAGKDRIWHCSLAIKAGQGIMDDQQWRQLVEDYLTRMGILDDSGSDVRWLAVRHGLSKNGNDHVHIVVDLATSSGWINPFHDRILAQSSCRDMERDRPELTALLDDPTRAMTTWEYRQWRRWAEWKAEHDWAGAEPFDSLDGRTRTSLINQVAADTMPRLSLSRLVEACARTSRSEDEFIRRVRREGLMIDPRLRKGVGKGSFTSPDQVVGYRITWRSSDGWKETINAYSMGDGMTLKQLRRGWHGSGSAAVREWRASMEHRRPAIDDGREKDLTDISAMDVTRIIDRAFRVAMDVRDAQGDGPEYEKAMSEGLNELGLLERDYGIEKAPMPFGTDALANHREEPGLTR